MDSNAKNSWSNRDAKFLALTSLEVRFMVDSSSCSNNKSLTNAIVTMILYFFDYRPRPRIVAAATCGRRTRKRVIQMAVTGLALGLFVLYNSFPWLTAELRGCVVLLPVSNSGRCIACT